MPNYQTWSVKKLEEKRLEFLTEAKGYRSRSVSQKKIANANAEIAKQRNFKEFWLGRVDEFNGEAHAADAESKKCLKRAEEVSSEIELRKTGVSSGI